MGYLLLSLSVLAGAAKGYCGKKTSGYVNEYKDAMLVNMIRMIFCVIIGFAIITFQSSLITLKADGRVLSIAALSGVMSAVFVVTWLIVVKKGAYIMLDVFLMSGLIVPLLGSSIMYGETISLRQILGLAILLTAVLIMGSYNNSIKGKMTLNTLILLIVCGLSSGCADFSQKLFVEYTSVVPIATFNFYSYIFSALVLGICFLMFPKSNESEPIKIRNILVYVIIMSVCLFANSFFQIGAAKYLSPIQLYPIAKGSALILSSLMAAIFFKERLTVKCVIGMAMSFAALLLINL